MRLRWTIIASLAGTLVTVAAAREPRAPVRPPDRLFRTFVWSYKEIQERNVVMQKRDYSCGAAALATIIRYYWGDPVTEDQFLRLLEKQLTPEQVRDRVENGLALTDLRDLANKAGYQASMGREEFNELAEAKVPVVVGLIVDGHEHFAVFRGAVNGWTYLADPLRGNVRVPDGLFRKQWQKNAILVVAKPAAKVKDVNPLAPRYEEVYRGWLNNQFVRQNALTPKPLPFVPGP